MGIKGWKLGAFRGQKRVNGGRASESGNKREACGTVGVKSKESGTRRFGKGARGPAFPAPSLTSANSALLLPSTSANRRAPGHVTTGHGSPPVTEVCASREEGRGGAPPSSITAQWKGLPWPREAGLWAEPILGGGARPRLCGAEGSRYRSLADMLMGGRGLTVLRPQPTKTVRGLKSEPAFYDGS